MNVVCPEAQSKIQRCGTWLGLASRDKDVREIMLKSSNQMQWVMGLGLIRNSDSECDPRVILLGHVIKLHLLSVGKLPSLSCRFCIWKMGTIYINQSRLFCRSNGNACHMLITAWYVVMAHKFSYFYWH